MNINDAAYAALSDQGYTGSLADMRSAFEKANGLSGNDSWNVALAAAGYTTGSLQDRLYTFWVDGLGEFDPYVYVNTSATDGGYIEVPTANFNENVAFTVETLFYPTDSTNGTAQNIYSSNGDRQQRTRIKTSGALNDRILDIDDVGGPTTTFDLISPGVAFREWNTHILSCDGAGTMTHTLSNGNGTNTDSITMGTGDTTDGGIRIYGWVNNSRFVGAIHKTKVWFNSTGTGAPYHYYHIHDNSNTIKDRGTNPINLTLQDEANGSWVRQSTLPTNP